MGQIIDRKDISDYLKNGSSETSVDASLDAQTLLKCYNLIVSEIISEYYRLNIIEKFTANDGVFEFKNLSKNVKNIAIFGETKQKIAFFANKYNFKNIYICDSLRSATVLCFEKSKPNYIVLLSPACASFDCFSNYEERGNVFKNIVKEIAFDENKKQKQSEKFKV